jgi:hypothetical protein
VIDSENREVIAVEENGLPRFYWRCLCGCGEREPYLGPWTIGRVDDIAYTKDK